ncbi:Ger(x)C family spore germination protein [Geosporobacter ferrireducens]|uniref:Spore gernimation protein n=1 Tax=Geosporobacter ferrireducens TaxID=1424294 RepID=A0A1D8GL16_9FIRM|nr:Ger(x)C family spore germination protein [Geosporobacter ferrireducens]AOT71589.1 spore gernimation protein [Geosporobacter ferrireducens]MTI55352.1 Ger(x)C family spore germination protein [Geosporobacter ferrireducens]
MRKIIKLLIMLLMSTSLTACWDSTGLENLLLVYGLGIDISKEDPEKYLFTIGFPTIIEEAPEKKMEFFTEAPSLGKGKSNLQNKVYRKISYDNIKVIVFGEEAARKGILPHIDSMFREPLFRGTTRFAVVEDRAVELLSMEPPVSLLVSSFLFDSIQQNYESTTVPIMTLRKFSHEYYTDGIEPAMPYICYGANRREINIGCVALFQKDKMIHTLHGDNSRGFMILRDEIHRGIYSFKYKTKEEDTDEYTSINLKGGKSKIKVKLEDSKLHIYQDITINCNLAEYTPKEIIFTKEKLKALEDYMAEEIKKDLISTIRILQKELKNDNIGYGQYVKAEYPEYFDCENWNEQFAAAIFHINTRVKIKNVGVTP